MNQYDAAFMRSNWISERLVTLVKPQYGRNRRARPVVLLANVYNVYEERVMADST